MHSRVYSSECLAHAVAHLSPVKVDIFVVGNIVHHKTCTKLKTCK